MVGNETRFKQEEDKEETLKMFGFYEEVALPKTEKERITSLCISIHEYLK